MLLQKPISRHFPSESMGSNLPHRHDEQPTKGPHFKAQVCAGTIHVGSESYRAPLCKGQHEASLPNVSLVVLNIC
jgi:hypothetical protein